MRELIAAEILASVDEKNPTVSKEFRTSDRDPIYSNLDFQVHETAFPIAIETIRRLNVLDGIINLSFVHNKYYRYSPLGKWVLVNSVKGLSFFERVLFRISTYRMLFEEHPTSLVTNTAIEILKEKIGTEIIQNATFLRQEVVKSS